MTTHERFLAWYKNGRGESFNGGAAGGPVGAFDSGLCSGYRAGLQAAVLECAKIIDAWSTCDDRSEKMIADIRAEFPEAFE